MKYFKYLNVRRKVCLVLGVVFFAIGLLVDSTLAVALATILILFSFVDEKELSASK